MGGARIFLKFFYGSGISVEFFLLRKYLRNFFFTKTLWKFFPQQVIDVCHPRCPSLDTPKNPHRSQVHYTPNPGIFQPPISGKLQFGLRLGENDPLFDRKLLEYLPSHGVDQFQIGALDQFWVGENKSIPEGVIRALCGLRFPFTEVFFAIYLQKTVHFYTLFLKYAIF